MSNVLHQRGLLWRSNTTVGRCFCTSQLLASSIVFGEVFIPECISAHPRHQTGGIDCQRYHKHQPRGALLTATEMIKSFSLLHTLSDYLSNTHHRLQNFNSLPSNKQPESPQLRPHRAGVDFPKAAFSKARFKLERSSRGVWEEITASDLRPAGPGMACDLSARHPCICACTSCAFCIRLRHHRPRIDVDSTL